jgi:hypothetical protein
LGGRLASGGTTTKHKHGCGWRSWDGSRSELTEISLRFCTLATPLSPPAPAPVGPRTDHRAHQVPRVCRGHRARRGRRLWLQLRVPAGVPGRRGSRLPAVCSQAAVWGGLGLLRLRELPARPSHASVRERERESAVTRTAHPPPESRTSSRRPNKTLHKTAHLGSPRVRHCLAGREHAPMSGPLRDGVPPLRRLAQSVALLSCVTKKWRCIGKHQ